MQAKDMTDHALGAAQPLRAGAFIVTLFGDAIVPRGGEVWVGNIIDTCASVGISETLVRTAVSRLVAAGVLVGARAGRRSFYRLAPRLQPEFADVSALLFDPAPRPEGWLLLALPEDAEAPAPFARLSPGVFLGPDTGGGVNGIALRAAPVAGGQGAVRDLAARLWSLPQRAGAWRALCEDLTPLLNAPLPEGLAALSQRLCVIHAFRRHMLEDPRLPLAALPADWPGFAARRAFAQLYLRLSGPADAYVDAVFCNASGSFAASGDTGQVQARLAAMQRLIAGPIGA